MYNDKPINEYLKELASNKPVPGGGSAAALVGATGVACLTKVVSFTIGKEKYKSVEKEMKDYLEKLETIRENFIQLCSEDAKAYKGLSDAFKMPKGDERTQSIQQALKEAMDVPLKVCKSAYEAISLCSTIRQKGNENLISDVDCAFSMLKCAYESGRINVEINLKSIKDEKFVNRTRKTLKIMRSLGTANPS